MVTRHQAEKIKKIQLPLTADTARSLRAGDEVLLSGTIYTARDQAHQRMVRLLDEGKSLPVDLRGAVIYYCGPTKTKPGSVIGSCGPTTSSRMDPFAVMLLEEGVRGMIGKGGRSAEVLRAVKKNTAVYFAATGGAGAYLSQRVMKARLVAFRDLGTEAIYELTVKDFPVVVAGDVRGKSVYR